MSGGDAMKERIGDALRNAAMRFGAALDLWHKGDLHVDESEGDGGKESAGEKKPAAQPPKPSDQPPTVNEADAAYHERVKTALKAIYCDDKAAALAKVEELTSFIPKGKTEADRVKGIRDFTKLSGQRLSILCHNIEKLVTPTCKACDGILDNGKCWNVNCTDFAG
jgi:hypothetical protein